MVIARCGEVRIWHWAHRARSDCDNRWETEGPWHRAWKNLFPDDWQEVGHHDENGKRFTADVKTDAGWVLEFQHSYLKPEVRRARDSYYSPKLVWIVDGLRRDSDCFEFPVTLTKQSLREASLLNAVAAGRGALLRDFGDSPAHVFFDFGLEMGLWWLFPKRGVDGQVYVAKLLTHEEFVEIHRGDASTGRCRFEDEIAKYKVIIDDYEAKLPEPHDRAETAEVAKSRELDSRTNANPDYEYRALAPPRENPDWIPPKRSTPAPGPYSNDYPSRYGRSKAHGSPAASKKKEPETRDKADEEDQCQFDFSTRRSE